MKMTAAIMSALTVVLVMTTITFATPEGSDKPALVVCYTTGSVNVQQARKATESMLRVLEKIGKWPEGNFQSFFTTSIDRCGSLLTEKKPHFISPSLGFFLEQGENDRLVPLVQPRANGRSTDTWRVIVLKGTFGSLDELKGKTLSGPLCAEPDFLDRIVFRGAVKSADHFALKPSKRALRPLRKLARGRLDAVLVNEQQYRSLKSLPFFDDLDTVFTSKPFPLLGIVAVKSESSAAEQRRFAGALDEFCDHPDGKQFCDLFGVDDFIPVEPTVYDEVKALWVK